MRLGTRSGSPAAVRAQVLLGATALLVARVVPLALAGADSVGPQATASASLAKQVKNLKRQVAQLRQQVSDLSLGTGPQGAAGPQGPTGQVGPPGALHRTGRRRPDRQLSGSRDRARGGGQRRDRVQWSREQ